MLPSAVAAGCGDEDDDPPAARAAGRTQLTLREVESVIDRGDLEPTRTADVDEHTLADVPPYLDAVRYDTRSGRTFHVIVFVSARTVERVMRRLRRACRPGSPADERLRRLCLRQVA